MKLLLLLAASLLASASVDVSPQPPASDGHMFLRKDFNKLALRIWVYEYPTREALHDAYQEAYPGVDRPTGMLGFAIWNRRGCYIHVMDPAVSYEPEVIGHELAHCLHGSFHSEMRLS